MTEDVGWLLLGLVDGILIGAGVTLWAVRRRERREQPYRWACLIEDCEFKVAASDMSQMLTIAERHEAWHREQLSW